MDPDQLPPSNPRKVRFAPKAPPPRRTPKRPDPKTEIEDEAPDDEEAAYSLRRLVKERLGRQGPKAEKKSSVQVAFAHGSSSATIKSYGVPREGSSSKSNSLGSRDAAADDEQILFSLPSTGEPYGLSSSSENALVASSPKIEREYKEPWDYHHTDYPITLPLRRPYSGNPELLDEAEFGMPLIIWSMMKILSILHWNLALWRKLTNHRCFFSNFLLICLCQSDQLLQMEKRGKLLQPVQKGKKWLANLLQ